ncbi:4-hydroxy-tetrahydrodipicolinate reductase [Alkalithermobacter thermoalcaliphilus JW-YL-7 = DSM 7308]|uniref:4-hydroxy-tetrahydrodipicolinate reductase n=1 Tax=Alkalithermobacter thermoalcaliphilus JW-YL-7 = DSM 7308 TaxID=1121328 RepID=A0A150FQG8_CLOPD|nr:dihydrodipicolinate reductase [[Clostridium] paradoxum JW-YL-7 = DSM 7308]SHK51412.1 4-hydroxy-tetrahydrodipicolinate reductase [[Clostridium] paradoxum JW-YL-7 = DSM 7308]
MENIKVGIWGFGAMGSGMAEMLLKKKGVEIVAVCDRNENRVGKDMYEVLGIERNERKEVIIKSDPNEVFTEKCADVVLLATDSFTKGAFEKIKFIVERKMNVISTAEEMAYPQAQEPELAKEIDRLAKENGVSVLGTGINPGFVLDLLILALTGTCETVEHIKAARINDLSPFGKAVMEEQGVGITLEQFNRGVENGTIAGHVGFPESIKMITDGIGWNLEKVEQTREAIVSNIYRESKYAKVEAGNVAGCRQCGYGYVDGQVKIEMEHPQQILPHLEGIETGDYIWIKGNPDISLQIKPEIPGGIGTIAMCVNSIPHVINAKPGLRTMLDIPVPRAIMGDMRDLIEC